jgi:hypothetical protein
MTWPNIQDGPVEMEIPLQRIQQVMMLPCPSPSVGQITMFTSSMALQAVVDIDSICLNASLGNYVMTQAAPSLFMLLAQLTCTPTHLRTQMQALPAMSLSPWVTTVMQAAAAMMTISVTRSL